MKFNEKTYNELLSWAGEVIHFKKMQNLVAADIVNDAFLRCVDKNIQFDFKNGKKMAMEILYGEMNLKAKTDRNYIEFGQGNPDYKGLNLPDTSACSTCKESKPVNHFYIKDGFYIFGECKKCCAIRAKRNNENPNKQKGVKKYMSINVKDEISGKSFEAISLLDLSQKTGLPTKYWRRILLGQFNSRAKVEKKRKQRQKKLNFIGRPLGINEYL